MRLVFQIQFCGIQQWQPHSELPARPPHSSGHWQASRSCRHSCVFPAVDSPAWQKSIWCAMALMHRQHRDAMLVLPAISVMRPTGKPPSTSSSSRQPKELLSASDMVLARTGLMQLMVNSRSGQLTCTGSWLCSCDMLVIRAACAPCLHRFQWVRARAGRRSHVIACSRDSECLLKRAVPCVKFGTPLLPGNAGRQPSTQHDKALEPGQGLRPSPWAIAIKESVSREGPFLLRIVAYSTIGAATIKSAN